MSKSLSQYEALSVADGLAAARAEGARAERVKLLRAVSVERVCDDGGDCCDAAFNRALDLVVRKIALNAAQDEPAEQGCAWKCDEDDTWWTTCGQGFSFFDEGPPENGFHFCCFCGQRLTTRLTPPEPCDSLDILCPCPTHTAQRVEIEHKLLGTPTEHEQAAHPHARCINLLEEQHLVNEALRAEIASARAEGARAEREAFLEFLAECDGGEDNIEYLRDMVRRRAGQAG